MQLFLQFPFDDQLCVIVFGSWSYTYTYLNYTLMNESPSLENYTENNEWSLLAYKPVRTEIKYDNWIEDDLFSEIRYKILIRRKPLFVLQNFVIPALMLCIITLVTFYIPFAQGNYKIFTEKIKFYFVIICHGNSVLILNLSRRLCKKIIRFCKNGYTHICMK